MLGTLVDHNNSKVSGLDLHSYVQLDVMCTGLTLTARPLTWSKAERNLGVSMYDTTICTANCWLE
jgi:hypothetical protein